MKNQKEPGKTGRRALALVSAMTLLMTGCANPQTAKLNADGTIDRKQFFVTVLTGPTSGIYYPIGGAFSRVVGDMGYKTSVAATGGTVENINAMETDQGELAIAMADSVQQAYEGSGAYEGKEPDQELRALMGLWPNYCQIVTTKDSGIKTFADLKGKRVGVGAPNSGVELNARMIFEANQMSYEDCKVDYLSYGEAIDQMKNGQCDAAFVTSGLGNATIKELAAQKEIAFVPVEGEALTRLMEKYPYFMEGTIPADTYGTEENYTTAAVMNILLVDNDLPEEVVYDLTKGIYENLDVIWESHKTAADNISLENAFRGIKIPLHEGAVRYYEEAGVLAENDEMVNDAVAVAGKE